MLKGDEQMAADKEDTSDRPNFWAELKLEKLLIDWEYFNFNIFLLKEWV